MLFLLLYFYTIFQHKLQHCTTHIFLLPFFGIFQLPCLFYLTNYTPFYDNFFLNVQSLFKWTGKFEPTKMNGSPCRNMHECIVFVLYCLVLYWTVLYCLFVACIFITQLMLPSALTQPWMPTKNLSLWHLIFKEKISHLP